MATDAVSSEHEAPLADSGLHAAAGRAAAADPDPGVRAGFGTDTSTTAGVRTERMGLPALAVATLLRPRRAMADIAAQPKKRWIAPLVLLAVMNTAFAVLYAPRSLEANRAEIEEIQARQLEGMDPEQAEAMRAGQAIGGVMQVVFSGVVAAVGTVIALLVGAAVLHFLSTVMGGQQAFLEVFSTAAWAKLPLILREVVRVPWLLLGGFDPNPAGLAGLAMPGGLGLDGGRSYLEPILSMIEVWTIWSLALLVLAVVAAAKLSRGRALAVVGIFVAAQIGLGMAGVAMANAFAQLF